MMEGGDSEAHSPGLIVACFRSFRFHPCAVVFVRGGRVCLRSRAVVFVQGRGSCPGRSSFVRGGRRRPRCRLWAPRRRAWVVGLVRGRCTSFVAGGLMFVGCGCRTRMG